MCVSLLSLQATFSCPPILYRKDPSVCALLVLLVKSHIPFSLLLQRVMFLVLSRCVVSPSYVVNWAVFDRSWRKINMHRDGDTENTYIHIWGKDVYIIAALSHPPFKKHIFCIPPNFLFYCWFVLIFIFIFCPLLLLFFPPLSQEIILSLLDVPQAMEALNGVLMELEDCAFPLLKGVLPTISLYLFFSGIF